SGARPSDSDLASIKVLARKHADNSLKFTNTAERWNVVPPALPGLGFDPGWDTIWLFLSVTLAVSPLYGVIVLDADSLDFFLSGAVPFTITKTVTPWTPPAVTWLAVDLAPLSADAADAGPKTKIIHEIDPLGRFTFSACRSDVSALPQYQVQPAMLPKLTPPDFTVFEDEMIVESSSNWADTLGAKGTLGRTPGLYR